MVYNFFYFDCSAEILFSNIDVVECERAIGEVAPFDLNHNTLTLSPTPSPSFSTFMEAYNSIYVVNVDFKNTSLFLTIFINCILIN